jgi:hypothetical protein
MATRAFNLMNGGIRYGKNLKINTASLFPGLFVKLDTSGSTVSTSGSTAATKPFGFLFGDRYGYRPTTRVYTVGEPVNVVSGVGVVSMTLELFDEGSLPTTPGATIYAAASGKWTANVTGNAVGVYVQTVPSFEPVGGVGASRPLAVVRFNIF